LISFLIKFRFRSQAKLCIYINREFQGSAVYQDMTVLTVLRWVGNLDITLSWYCIHL